ncbi:hypothetical protein E4U42_003820 [Claviceps africana]|uniref:SGNH hydrolase-type esterase domain-containing protein n=1 Tax=Claviceps africana TaxID=83212 RepID=A0A8K0JC86_9HYPO|nr:hypothetical protein E4U42_003820 [Claviceps africana]
MKLTITLLGLLSVSGSLTASIALSSDGASLRRRPLLENRDGRHQHVLQSPSQSEENKAAMPFPHWSHHRHAHENAPLEFVALGDSYSAGIGTGSNGAEDDCRHGSHAYPKLIQADLDRRLNPSHAHVELQFLSCTGSTIDDMLSGSEHSQIDSLNVTSSPDFALVSIGGNDLGFFAIMNSCVFRFYSLYSGTCDEALRESDSALNAGWFEHRLRLALMELLDRIQWEKHPWFTITVTGYARFFNEHTDDCDHRSFGVWWRGPKLKRDLRRRMNQMVLSVNDKIRQSVNSINMAFAQPRVFFVDYDDAFEGHRFCEPDVTEPDYTRNSTWFFLVGGSDNAEEDLKARSVVVSAAAAAAAAAAADTKNKRLLTSGSALADPDTCLVPAEKSGDWGQLAVCLMAMALRDEPGLRASHNMEIMQSSMWYVPTYYGKTFHPRTLGHRAIRDRVYESWTEQRLGRW